MKSSAEIANDEAFEAGRAAFFAQMRRSSNPESAHSSRAFNWDNGWLSEAKNLLADRSVEWQG